MAPTLISWWRDIVTFIPTIWARCNTIIYGSNCLSMKIRANRLQLIISWIKYKWTFSDPFISL